MAIRKSKWIADCAPEESISSVARRAVDARLATFWHYLPLAARQPDDDPEYVHQLRVAARRAVAALDTFSEVLPPKRRRNMRRKLRRARRAAGAARDLDVLLERFEQADTETHDDRAVLLRLIRSRRQQAQPALVELYKHLKRRRFPRRIRRLVSRARWRDKHLPEPTYGDTARSSLRALVEETFRDAPEHSASTEALHAFRIQLKRLRYAMELFAGAFPPELRREIYPQIAHLQQLLGNLNDRAAFIERLETWRTEEEAEETRQAIERQLVNERAALNLERTRLEAQWKEHDLPQLRWRLDRLLDDHLPAQAEAG